MSLRAYWCAWGRSAEWALPILAGLLFAPGAHAECGDYVATRLSVANAASAQSHDMPAAPVTPAVPAPHKPCSGPHCSRLPAAPPAPVPTAPTRAAQEWGHVPDGLDPAPLAATTRLFEQQLSRPMRIPSSIFHPPRFSA
jgi:hypothetical protein